MCVLVALAALATVATTWRSLLPRKEWEDPSITGINRLAAHSRLGNYSSFEGAVARGQSRNVVSLRCGEVCFCGTRKKARAAVSMKGAQSGTIHKKGFLGVMYTTGGDSTILSKSTGIFFLSYIKKSIRSNLGQNIQTEILLVVL